MREIYFKAKRLDDGEWVEGSLIVLDADSGYYFITEPYQSASTLPVRDLIYNHTYLVDANTICQYTGLTDKARNKAFENSIIKLISENVFGIVKFGEYKSPFENEETKHVGFYVDWENDDRCKFWRKDLGYWLNASTVICGNIFDNNMGDFNGC